MSRAVQDRAGQSLFRKRRIETLDLESIKRSHPQILQGCEKILSYKTSNEDCKIATLHVTFRLRAGMQLETALFLSKTSSQLQMPGKRLEAIASRCSDL